VRFTTVFNKLLALQAAFVRGVAFGPAQIVVDVVKRPRRHRCPVRLLDPCPRPAPSQIQSPGLSSLLPRHRDSGN
jgi:hypothetical protein